MVLQGCFDDSGTSDGEFVCVVAGFISSLDEWKLFSEEWKAKLDESPSIRYFRMADAMAMRGEFARGWNPELRDQRIFELSEIINKHVIVGVESRLRRDYYDRLIRGLSPILDDPYFLIVMQLIFAIHHWQIVHKYPECHFIFDEQSDLARQLLLQWPTFKGQIDRDRTYPDSTAEEWIDLIRHPPIFRDDRKFLPLQAADMFAWIIRDRVSRRELDMPESSRVVVNAISRGFSELETISRDWSYDDLLQVMAHGIVRQGRQRGLL